MYEWTDTERNIKNTFAPDLIAKGTYCMQEIIYLVTKGFMKRDCIPADILKRMDAELELLRIYKLRNKETIRIHNLQYADFLKRMDAEIKFVRETQVEKTLYPLLFILNFIFYQPIYERKK